MPNPVKRKTRRYRSIVRTEQAQETRRRILDAAKDLFVERGYAGTTVDAVAAAAGVSPETIYGSLGGKRGLLEGVIDASIVGPDGEGPLVQRPAFERVGTLPTARERLRGFVEACCLTLARTSPVHVVIRGAADREPFAVELRERLLRERLANNVTLLRKYVSNGLRPGLTLKQASERFCGLTSPEFYHLMTVELGWTPRQFTTWLSDLAELELLGPPGF
jgi:AcrR family transcriptional regulator